MLRPMPRDMQIDLSALRTRVETFARSEIAPRGDLRDHEVIPAGLWRAIGEAGLAGIGLPAEYGGAGGDLRAIAVAGEAMAAAGGVKGVVTCWLSRQLNSREQILGHGTEAQRRQYLPELAAGRLTPALAISEPGAGAHPKHLSTTAERDGDDYVLNGEKAYLTNGPIADIFLVLAITGVEGGRNRFSLFIVPKAAAGLTVTEGVKVDFLRPAPHCGLRLTDVRIPAANLLGPEGDAFPAISLPMRKTEDAMFAATIAGSMRHQIDRLARELEGETLDEAMLAELGQLATAPDGLAALGYRAVELLDLGAEQDPDQVSRISAAARDWARRLQDRIGAFIEESGLTPSPGLAAETRDIVKTLGIARSAHAIQAQRRARTLMETVVKETT
jgi:acyl-CoA dehydrogenase